MSSTTSPTPTVFQTTVTLLNPDAALLHRIMVAKKISHEDFVSHAVTLAVRLLAEGERELSPNTPTLTELNNAVVSARASHKQLDDLMSTAEKTLADARTLDAALQKLVLS